MKTSFFYEVLKIQTILFFRQQNTSEKKQTNKLCKNFFNMIDEVDSYLSHYNIAPDSFSQTIFNELVKLSSSQKPSLVVKLLRPLLSQHSLSDIDFNTKVGSLYYFLIVLFKFAIFV